MGKVDPKIERCLAPCYLVSAPTQMIGAFIFDAQVARDLVSGALQEELSRRIALGAEGSRILRLVLKEGGTLAVSGLVFGLGGAYLVGRAMQTTLYGVKALDIGAFSASAFMLLTAALLACYIPARRASKVDPLVALRCE